MKGGNFFAELQRRQVYKVALAYAVVGWLLIQVATQVFPFFAIPNWIVRLIILLLVIGFPVALILAWAFEITPEGIKREEDVDSARPVRRTKGRKLTAVIQPPGKHSPTRPFSSAGRKRSSRGSRRCSPRLIRLSGISMANSAFG